LPDAPHVIVPTTFDADEHVLRAPRAYREISEYRTADDLTVKALEPETP